MGHIRVEGIFSTGLACRHQFTGNRQPCRFGNRIENLLLYRAHSTSVDFETASATLRLIHSQRASHRRLPLNNRRVEDSDTCYDSLTWLNSKEHAMARA